MYNMHPSIIQENFGTDLNMTPVNKALFNCFDLLEVEEKPTSKKCAMFEKVFEQISNSKTGVRY